MISKKPTEFAVNSFLSQIQIAQLKELDAVTELKLFNKDDPCHIYMICTRPRISLYHAKCKVSPDLIELVFKIHQKDDFKEYKLTLRNEFKDKSVVIESDFPYNYFTIKNDKENFYAKTAALIHQISGKQSLHPDFIDLDVLYVGQSYGIEGARTAPDRLKNHSTLQNIFAEVSSQNPDKEVWLALTSFRQFGITKFDGVTNFTKAQRKGDKQRTMAFWDKMKFGGITEQQFINFTEAALIRYFQPSYNIKFKNTFPNPAHSTYSECYELDINTVNVELGTKDANNVMLFNEHVSRKPRHFATFIMHNKEERIGMFEI